MNICKVTWYKVEVWVLSIHYHEIMGQRNLKKIVTYTIASKSIKYLGQYLTKKCIRL